jgi:hypothetical protein
MAGDHSPMEQTLSALFEAAAEQGLAWLLIGGNAIVLFGYPRLTIDIDLLVPAEKQSQWLDLMRGLGFRFLHGTAAFAQFQPGVDNLAPVDLMFVDSGTWKVMMDEACSKRFAGRAVMTPRLEHLIALKLHAVSSPTRGDNREQDWQDIRQMVRAWHLDPADAYFREMILRYGGEDALNRILRYSNES